MASSRARVAMHFADGTVIDTWNKLSLHKSYTDPLDAFTLETIPIFNDFALYKKRLGKGELVTIYIDDLPQGDYLIVTSERTSSEAGEGIEVTCHTPLVTPHEGDVDPDFSLHNTSDVSVSDAILAILGPYGFNKIIADTRASVSVLTGKAIGGKRPNTVQVTALKFKDLVGHEGETAYAAIARLITRLGVCLRMAPDGTLLVGEPDYNQDPCATVIRSTNPYIEGDYFVGPVKVRETNEGQFSACTVRGQRSLQLGVKSASRPTGSVASASVLPARCAYRSTTAPWKPKYFKDKSSRDPDTALSVAHLELGARAVHAFTIDGAVNLWKSSTGVLWQPDIVARVVHSPEGIDEPFWLAEVTRTQNADVSGNGGQMTHLKFIPKGALILGTPKGS